MSYVFFTMFAASVHRFFTGLSETGTGGHAAFGDLMVRNVAVERDLIAYYRGIDARDTAEAFEEEYFWRIDETPAAVADTELTVAAIRKFSALSWGILLTKPLRGGRP